MKIEIGESLGYSYLRHVKECWLVQTNWKPSEHWHRFMDDIELESLFESMRERFDSDGSVLKMTKNVAQFLQQAEIDVMGIDREGCVYAIDVAFHEAGLNYGSKAETIARVLKKLLRTMMTLQAYHPTVNQLHITFASPKVNPGVQKPLKAMFDDLQATYPEVVWKLLTNEAFAEQMLEPTLQKAGSVADTSELFMRSAKLLDVAKVPTPKPRPRQPTPLPNPDTEPNGIIQPLVQDLMKTLLEDYPTLLDEHEPGNMMDEEYCKHALGLRIGNFPLLRPQAEGRQSQDGRDRYYRRLYAGRYYVCSQWGKRYHRANAESLLQFVNGLVQRKQDHPEIPVLDDIRRRLQVYVG